MRNALAVFVLAFMACYASSSSLASPPSFTVHVGQPQIVLSPSQRQKMGLPNFPDTSPSIFWDGQDYMFFAAQGVGASSPLSGSIRLKGSLQSPVVDPADAKGNPIPSIRAGIVEPAPGSNFDLNYAGGGALWFDVPTHSLLQVYHGEFDLGDPPSPKTFYTTLGLAISYDLGKTFKKVGPIISPNLPMSAGRTAASSSGSIVLYNDYLYLFYSDIDADNQVVCGITPCVAVARAPVRDVVDEAAWGGLAEWQKYYQGAFTEPGIGGRFTPLFIPKEINWARWPQVEFNEYTQSYIMTYAAGLTGGIVLRESTDGITWSDPLFIFPPTNGHSINYPGVASETVTPHLLEQQFWVYYRDYPGTDATDPATVANSSWNRIQVTLQKSAP